MFTTKKEGNSCEMQIIWVPQGFFMLYIELTKIHIKSVL